MSSGNRKNAEEADAILDEDDLYGGKPAFKAPHERACSHEKDICNQCDGDTAAQMSW